MDNIKKRGFASLSPERRREIAREGGKATSQNKAHMSAIGQKGGLATGARKRAAKNAVDVEYLPTDNL